jgi:signal transduction histidine kinase
VGDRGGQEVLEQQVARLGRVERRMARLLAVSGDLAGARTREDVARIAIHKGLDAVGASYGGFWIHEPDDATLRLLEASPLPVDDLERWRVVPLDIDAPLPRAVRTATPLFLTAAQFEEQFPASFERVRGTMASPDPGLASVPLVVEGAVLGAIAMTYAAAVDLDDNERTFLAILGRQCGLALARIRLHDAERVAHLEREEILSVVSHDLRNPLGTILIGASALLELTDPLDPKAQRVRTIGERINRQAERMARLIEDLVDFAGIQAGKLSVERKPHAPATLVDRAAERLAPLAHERGLAFDAEVARDLPLIDCDDSRVSQILSNLVGNAVRVTPKSGRICVGARLEGTEVVFFVSDTGPGLDPDELPLLFQRYWRSKQSTYKGAGIGLSIARGIVDVHGGRIWAESERGKGCCFFFTLVAS